jgi:hypothetical protein
MMFWRSFLLDLSYSLPGDINGLSRALIGGVPGCSQCSGLAPGAVAAWAGDRDHWPMTTVYRTQEKYARTSQIFIVQL